jgi:hypothetical protein
MLPRRFCVLAASMLLGIPSIVTANPVTYNFTGTLTTPVNGSNQFSGSFTINANATVGNTGLSAPYFPYWISENGNDVSMTVTLGGQTTTYANTSQYQNLATLTAAVNPASLPASGNPSGDVVTVGGVPAYSDPGYNPGFFVSFTSPTDPIFSQLRPNNVANLLNFNFSSTANSDHAQFTNTSGVIDDGTITSIAEVPAPEPSALAVFAMLGVAAIVHHRHRRRNSSQDLIAG